MRENGKATEPVRGLSMGPGQKAIPAFAEHGSENQGTVVSANDWLERQKERDFNKALNAEMTKKASDSARVVNYQSLEADNMGFAPNANLMPAHHVNNSVQPSTVHRVSYKN